MEAIGGYFELELPQGEHYHKNAIRLNTARNCFEYILHSRGYDKVFIPYFTCEVLLEPIRKLGVRYEFYHINERLEPFTLPKLNANEAFLYTNYFGLKQDCVKRMAMAYGKQLIVDNAQAFYAEPLEGIDTFYSARKFFGVPDGSYLYTDKPLQQEFAQDCSYERMSHLLKRLDLGAQSGYQDFRNNDNALCNQDIKRMSKITEALLCGINYDVVRNKRKENYQCLENAIGDTNRFNLVMAEESVPLVYPYLTDDDLLKQKLIEKEVFVATYWPNVLKWCNHDDFEYGLAKNTVCLPVDQRNGLEEMQIILGIINANQKQ